MKRHVFVIVLLLLCVTGARGQSTFVNMQEREPGAFTIEGYFFVKSSTAIAWDVLTDYDHINQFVSSMKQSRVIHRNEKELMVEQRAKGNFLFVSRTAEVLLDIHENPPKNIHFEDVSHKHFSYYKGYWKLQPTTAGVLVFYRLEEKSKFSVPRFVKKKVINESVRELLEQVKAEISKRTEKKH